MVIRGILQPVLAQSKPARKQAAHSPVDQVTLSDQAAQPDRKNAMETGQKVAWGAALSGHIGQMIDGVKSLFGKRADSPARAAAPPPPPPPPPRSRQSFLDSIPPDERSDYERLADRLTAANPQFSKDHWKAVEELFDRSNSRQGRAVKRMGLETLIGINPTMTADVLSGVARCTNACPGWEARERILQSMVRIFTANPKIDEPTLDGVQRLLARDNDETLAIKLNYLTAMFDRNPRISGAFLSAVGDYVNRRNDGPQGCEIKLEHVTVMLDKNPALSPQMLRSISRFVNSSDVKSLNGCLLKMDFLNRVMKVRPDIDADFVDCVAAHINQINGPVHSHQARCAKASALTHIIEKNPTIDIRLLKKIMEFVDTPTYAGSLADDRIAKAQGLEALFKAKPNVSEAELKSLMRQAQNANGPDECRQIFDSAVGAVRKQEADTRREAEVRKMAGWIAPRTDSKTWGSAGRKTAETDPHLSGSGGHIERQEKKLVIGRISIPVRKEPEEPEAES